jgi:uncharacterized protein (DUF362 family)
LFGAAALANCGSNESAGNGATPDGGSGGSVGSDANPTTAVVSVVGELDVDAAVARAVELAGGLDAIQPGQTVFIKPNAVHGSVAGMPGVITGFEVLGAVVRLVKERGARVIVGDRSARQVGTSESVFRMSGLTTAMLAAGADEVYPAPRPIDDPSAWVLVQPPRYQETWAAAGGILAMRKILEADHLIDVPVCKNHRWAAFSLAMKNFIGAIGDDSRDPLHFRVGDADRLGRDIAILNQAFRPLVCVLDALTAVVNGGPEGVGPDRVATTPRLVMASRDRVALDAAGISLIKHQLARTAVPAPDVLHSYTTTTPAWSSHQIRHAIERGLGASGPADVQLRFDSVAIAAELEAMYRAT